ncbi:MAG: 3-phosphoshikimate 1-carboxyvinyltransferase [Phycisphaerae bacterium]|nr:3-phosphoshikimate 1-carboxyvinyltransferase [Phycisphaerae bacterium]
MILTAKKSTLRGRVAIPGSKSHTIRAVALGALAPGESEIISPLVSSDTKSAVDCYRKLGAQIQTDGHNWLIEGTGGKLSTPDDVINVGNSGTTLRFAIGSAALLHDGAAVLTGDDQIRNRPVGPLLESFNRLGAQCTSTRNNGMAPVIIKGRANGGQTEIEAITSQYLSSLLINAPLADNDTIINVTRLNEKPYVEITLRYLDEHHIQYENENYKRFIIKGGQSYRPFSKRIPADFSSATFFFAAGAILDAELTLEGLDFSDAQGDKAVVNVLKEMGADIQIADNEVIVRPGDLKGIEIDMNAIPDALPAMAVVGCFASGETRLVNVAQARLKETDRIAVMARELSKMGANIQELPDGLVIKGGKKLNAANLCGHHDHRIVMALSLAAMSLEKPSSINTAEAVKVTFPNYVTLMQLVGAHMNCY